MDFIKQILTEISEGKKTFKPAGPSQSDMEDFQSVVKVLIHAYGEHAFYGLPNY